MLRPMRVFFNERVLYPVLSHSFTNVAKVVIPKENPFAVIIQKNEHDKVIKVKTPFGKWWSIPFCLLLSINSIVMAKKLTLYHIILTFIVPIFSLFILINLKSKNLFIISSTTSTIDLFIGLSFIIFWTKILFEKSYYKPKDKFS